MVTRCPDCKTIYKTTGEILQAGGCCKNIGLSLFGWCGCGAELQGMNKLWKIKRYEQLAEQQTEPLDYPQPLEIRTGD